MAQSEQKGLEEGQRRGPGMGAGSQSRRLSLPPGLKRGLREFPGTGRLWRRGTPELLTSRSKVRQTVAALPPVCCSRLQFHEF
jgi:hypothetical protein